MSLFVFNAPHDGLAALVAEMDPTNVGNGTCGHGAFTYNVSLQPSATVTTDNFGVVIVLGGELGAPVGSASPGLGAGCHPSPNTWFGVLWSGKGVPQATYGNPNASTEWMPRGNATLPVSVANGMVFEVVSNQSLWEDGLSFYGVNGASVTGTVELWTP